MKKIAIIKKKEVILGILAIFLMLVGFISYRPTSNSSYDKIADVNNYSETLGDATLVSSNDVEENLTNQENTTENTIIQDEIVETDYFKEARLDREKTYSETLEVYEKILENANVTADQKTIAQNEISNISNEKKSIATIENLIKMKGFEDVVVFKNISGVSVIVKSDVLTKEQVAQIQNIIERELQVESKNINITNK